MEALLVDTGLGRSELFGLRLGDVDLGEGGRLCAGARPVNSAIPHRLVHRPGEGHAEAVEDVLAGSARVTCDILNPLVSPKTIA